MNTRTTHTGDNEASILVRVLSNQDGLLPPEVARYIQSRHFSDGDKARMHDLVVRNQDDALSPAEKAEMFAFGKAGTLLDILHSRARRTLGIKPDGGTADDTHVLEGIRQGLDDVHAGRGRPAEAVIAEIRHDLIPPAADPVIGSMRDAADLLDEIVADAMRRRQLSGWLPSKEDFDTLERACAQTDRTLYELLDEALGVWLQSWRLRQDEPYTPPNKV